MAAQFDFDEKKTAQENIEEFLAYIEGTNKVVGQILRQLLPRMLPLPDDPTKRSAVRASFNSEIKKLLDAILTARKAKHD